MATEGRRFRRRKKEQIFVDGYYIDHANDVMPGVDRNDEVFHLFGKDTVETDVQHNNGTLTIGVLDKYENNIILDLITGQDPTLTTPRQYRIQDLTSVHVWANVKDAKDTRYVKSWLCPGWSPGMPYPSGDPNAKAQVTISGNAGLPRQFQGAWIKSKKVLTGGSLGDTPVVVPGEAGVYAVAIKALKTISGVFEQEEVQTVSAAMMNSAGTITHTEINAQLSTQMVPYDALFILYLQTGTGIYPAVVMGKLRE